MADLAGLQPVFYGVQKRTSMLDYEGHLARVFFTAGCNFRCGFCHNPEMVYDTAGNLPWDKVKTILDDSHEEWVDGIVITGGEPTMHPNLADIIKMIRDQGYKVKLDTNGALPERLGKVLDLVDFIAMDYKAPLNRYSEFAGIEVDGGDISASVAMLKDQVGPGSYEIRTTVIEQMHTLDDMEAIGQELEGIDRYVIQPFIPQTTLLDPSLAGLQKTGVPFMQNARDRILPYIPTTIVRGVDL